MLRQYLKIVGAPLAQISLRRQRKNPTHGVVVGAHDNTPPRRWRSDGAQRLARIPPHPLCASSALPSATLASAPLAAEDYSRTTTDRPRKPHQDRGETGNKRSKTTPHGP